MCPTGAAHRGGRWTRVAEVRRDCAGDVRLVADVARVDGDLPPVASRLEARAQVGKPVRSLCLDGSVERREEHAALPRHVTPEGGRPGPASGELVEGGDAAGPPRRAIQAMARRVASYTAWPRGKVAVVGRVEPRDLAREVQAALHRRGRLELEPGNGRRFGVAGERHTLIEERLHLQILVVAVEHGRVHRDPPVGHRALQAPFITPRELGPKGPADRRDVDATALEAPRGRNVDERLSRDAWYWTLAFGVQAS